MRQSILPFPKRGHGARGPEMWVDEAIWGHRLYDEQTPWLAFLEFLNVLYAQDDKQRFKESNDFNRLAYHPKQSLHLRHILFNNPRMLALLKEAPDDDSRWSSWEKFMCETAVGLSTNPDFSFVRTRFQSFEDFSRVVQLLRSTAIEGESNKRWTSKFVFPYGPAALYEDLNVRPTGVTNDRRFFGRVGELVYLMLCRSGKGQELLAHMSPLVLNDQSPWNRLVRALISDEETDKRAERGGAYLPYERRPEFDNFAQDWLALFECQMPGYDVMPHLVALLGLHVVLYKLRCAYMWVAPESPVQLVLEIIAPRRTPVRDLAVETYLSNNFVSREAIEAYIKETVEQSDEWQAALNSSDPYGSALTVLQQKVLWPPQNPDGDEDYGGPRTPDGLLDSTEGLRTAALRRHMQHVGNVHAVYTREIGLASRRGTRRYRYAPNDHILRSLIFANVPRRMEFQQFLDVLHERYGFIIGHRQAATYIEQGQADQKTFEDNALRLEMRLASLGLLRRLSDACAYVHNPYVT